MGFEQQGQVVNYGEKRTEDEIIRRLGFHPATPEVVETYAQLRQAAIDYALKVNELCPESREKSLALTSLQETSMWAIGSVATNLTPVGGEGTGAR
jgi:hypothetical protein